MEDALLRGDTSYLCNKKEEYALPFRIRGPFPEFDPRKMNCRISPKEFEVFYKKLQEVGTWQRYFNIVCFLGFQAFIIFFIAWVIYRDEDNCCIMLAILLGIVVCALMRWRNKISIIRKIRMIVLNENINNLQGLGLTWKFDSKKWLLILKEEVSDGETHLATIKRFDSQQHLF